MAPNTPIEVEQEQPLSRTYQYRKVMKPMLERKRRARINKYLDELKDLMVSALANEGENVTKLEKADVLELTVRHLRKLKQNHLLGVLNPNVLHERYMAGFAHCASQVGSFLAASAPGPAETAVSQRLMGHVSKYMQALEKVAGFHGGFPVAPAHLSAPSAAAAAAAAAGAARIITPPLTPPAHPSAMTSSQPLHVPVRVHCDLMSPGVSSRSELSPTGSDVSVSSGGASSCRSPRADHETDPETGDDDKMWRPW